MDARFSTSGLLLVLWACFAWGCGGGGGTARFGPVGLEELRFPDPSNQSAGADKTVPDEASLIQTIEYRFSGPINPGDVGPDSLPICDEDGALVSGEYRVRESLVEFHPSFPLRPARALGGGEWDTGGAGLRPSTLYLLTVPVGTNRALPQLRGISETLWERHAGERTLADGVRIGRNATPEAWTRRTSFSLRFHTTGDSRFFFTGCPATPPHLLSTRPDDGAEDVSPHLFTDPGHLFAPPRPVRLTFDGPLGPSHDNIGPDSFKLLDLDYDSGGSDGLELGVRVVLVSNRYDRAVVEIEPSGILPFGDRLAVAHSASLRGISGGHEDSPGDVIDAVFRVAAAPRGRVRDRFAEDFHDTRRRETRMAQLGPGVVPAAWDEHDSGGLQAAVSYPEGPVLGPFVPVAPQGGTHEIVLDTDAQALPLFDGSTPEAPPGTLVLGGHFTFTEIVIPEGVRVKAVGHHPLFLVATGAVRIAGTIDVSGTHGGDDQSYDSAVSPTPGGPGGPGGGRGGMGNPTRWYGVPQLASQVPPRRGERGWGPGDVEQIGGGGGEGAAYPERGWPCGKSHCNKLDGTGPFSRGSGGGGGSYLREGTRGRDGAGMKVSLESLDPSGYPIFDTLPYGQAPGGGLAGRRVFVNDDPLDDFIGALGEIRGLIGGQGGGGGGNRHDSLECAAYVFANFPGFPGVLADSKGAGGGGGGGAVVVEAVGTITLAPTAVLSAAGGDGGRGEQIGCSNWGGGGGGGAGGAILLRSAARIEMQEAQGVKPVIDVHGGIGGYSMAGCGPYSSCGPGRSFHPGSGGDAGDGLVQLQVPAGTSVDDSRATIIPESSLVPPEWTPSELSPISIGQSVWIDTGTVLRRGPASPGFAFTGTDPRTGLVLTDKHGRVRHPGQNDFAIVLPPVIDQKTGLILQKGEENTIPEGAWIRIEFQAADAVRPGSRDVDPASIVPGPGLWSGDVSLAEGRQFVRYRVVFNIADAGQGYRLGPDRRRPIVEFLRLPFTF